MPRVRPLLLMLILFALFSVARVQGVESVRALLADGQWQEAAYTAAALGTSEGFALAAEALTDGGGVVPDQQKKALFLQAQEYARQAIRKGGNNPEGYFRLGVAQGRLAQFVGILESLGLAKEVRRNLERALKLGMNTAPPHVALGLWHATVASKGALAAVVTGASRSEALAQFKTALILEPDNLTARLEYAHALLLLDRTGNRSAALVQLQVALGLTPADAWQRRDLEAARSLLGSLK